MKKYLTNNILLKIASVIFAIILWLIVLNIDDPDTTRTISNIEVTIENADAVTSLNKIYNIVAGQTATVSVTGPRSIVDKLTAADFVATADFNELSQTNSVPINVDLKKQTYSDKVIINSKTYTMRLSIEDIESKEFEVEIRNIGYLADNYVIYSNRISNKTVTVYAPTSVMNTIAGVVAEVVSEGQSENFTSEITLSCVGMNGRSIDSAKNNITIDSPTATVTCVVYFSKEVSVTDTFENAIPNGYSIIEKTLSSDKVTIVGNRDVVDGINTLVIPEDILEIVSNNKDYTIACDIAAILPDGVYVYGGNREITVSMHIDRMVERIYNIDVKKLALANIPENYVASIVTKGSFSYTLAGMEDVLRNYQTQDAYNVSLEGLLEGTHSVRVNINVEDGYSLVREVYVEVNLEKIDEGNSTTKDPNEETTTKRDEETTDVKENETDESTADVDADQENTEQ